MVQHAYVIHDVHNAVTQISDGRILSCFHKSLTVAEEAAERRASIAIAIGNCMGDGMEKVLWERPRQQLGKKHMISPSRKTSICTEAQL